MLFLSSAVCYGHVAGGIGTSSRPSVPQGSSVCYWHGTPSVLPECFALQKQAVGSMYRNQSGTLPGHRPGHSMGIPTHGPQGSRLYTGNLRVHSYIWVGGFVVATRLRTLTGSVRSRAKQAICESISYHDTILGRVWEEWGRGDMEVDV